MVPPKWLTVTYFNHVLLMHFLFCNMILKVNPTDGDAVDLMKRASVAVAMNKGKWEESEDFRTQLKDESEAQALEQQAKSVTDSKGLEELIRQTYEKVEKGFVAESHLKMRMHMLKLGVMKAPIAQSSWKYWKGIKSDEFIKWFEAEIYGVSDSFNEGYQEEVIPNVRRK